MKQSFQVKSFSLSMKIIGVVSLGLVLVSGFNNCSNARVDVDLLESNENVVADTLNDSALPTIAIPPDDAVEIPIPTSPAEYLQVCNQAALHGRIQSQEIYLEYEDSNGCNWDTDDNWVKTEGKVSARKSQARTLSLSAGQEICGLEIAPMANGTFTYDDNLFVTLNYRLLASTADFNAGFESQDGLIVYDWFKLRGQDTQNADSNSTSENQFCQDRGSGSDCNFPITGSQEAIKLNFPQNLIQKVLSQTNYREAKLRVVTIGDNDDSDCRHSPIKMKVKLSYIQR